MSEPARELDLRDFVGVARRRRRWIVVTPLIILLLVVVGTATRQRVYEATAEVLILTDANQAIFPTTAAASERLRRNPVAEQQYLSGEDFRNVVGPAADGVQSMTYELGRTDPDEDLADVAILRFVARADTASGVVAAANSAAGLYIDSRHRQDRARVTEQLEVLGATLVRLRAAQAEADDQLASLRAQLQGSLSESEQEQLQANIAVLDAQQFETADRVRETIEEIAALEQVSDALDDPFAAARVQNPAETPTAPVSPDIQRNIVLATIAGLVLGVAFAIARDLLDGSARDPVELVHVTGAPVLGAVEVMPADPDGVAPAHVHRYRTILKSLALTSASPALRTIGVTSATASVGKTLTVVNLARAEASSGSRVLIIDADPVTPMTLSRLDPHECRAIDIVDALAAEPSEPASARPAASDRRRSWESFAAGRNAAGVPKIDVIQLFSSESATGDPLRHTAMEPVLEKLAEHYDLILIHTHAVLSSVGVRPLLTGADAVVVVYDPSRSRVDDLARTVGLLRDGGLRVAGFIANRAPAATPDTRDHRGSSSMTVDVTETIVIERPVGDVAAFAGDPTNAPQWYRRISSAERVTDPPIALGSRTRFRARFLGRDLTYTYEITEYTPGEQVAMRTTEAPFPMATTYTWQRMGDRVTHMTLRNHGEPTGLFKLAAPLIANAMRRAMRQDLADLKRLLESH